MEPRDPDDDPVEEEFKQNLWPYDPNDICDIDKYLDAVGTTKLRVSLGNPTFRPLAEIPADKLGEEVERILDFLAENAIEVDLQGASPAEAYRYLTTEMMDQEIEDPRAPGWTSVFAYWMLHPTLEDDDEAEKHS